jgi:hypothetical protein
MLRLDCVIGQSDRKRARLDEVGRRLEIVQPLDWLTVDRDARFERSRPEFLGASGELFDTQVRVDRASSVVDANAERGQACERGRRAGASQCDHPSPRAGTRPPRGWAVSGGAVSAAGFAVAGNARLHCR